MIDTSSDLIAVVERLRHVGDDGQSIEAKRARGGLPKDLWETVSAFANRWGGTILLGVDQADGFAISGVDDPGGTARRVAEVCSAEMEPPVRASIETYEVDGRSVVVVEVPSTPRSERPCHHKREGALLGSRIRVGDNNRRLSEYEVALLLSERTQPAHDREPVATARLSDLEEGPLVRFMERIRTTRPTIFRDRTDAEIRRMFNITVTVDGIEIPTLAGLLTFGTFPQQFLPQLNVTVVAYPTGMPGVLGPRGERFTDNQAIDGNVAAMLAGTLEVLRRHMKRRGIVEGLVRLEEWEYPTEVLREAIVNALVHRDYSAAARGAQVQVEIFPDRLVIRNPGGLFGPVSEGELGFVPTTSSRNSALLKILEDAHAEPGRSVCENRGSGIAAMRAELVRAGMQPPHFRDLVASFEVEISNESLLDQETLDWIAGFSAGPLAATQLSAVGYLRRQGGTLTNAAYRSVTGISDSRAAGRELRDLVERGVLRQHGTRGSATYRMGTPSAVGTSEPLPDRLIDALGDDQLNRNELAGRLGVDPQVVAQTLVTMRKEGRVELIGLPRSKNARWRVTSSPGGDPSSAT